MNHEAKFKEKSSDLINVNVDLISGMMSESLDEFDVQVLLSTETPLDEFTDEFEFGYNGTDRTNSTAQEKAINVHYIVITSVLILLCIVAVVINVRILICVRWIRRPLSPTLHISLSLALADACIAVLVSFSFRFLFFSR